jgi:hypothetical protein
VAAGGDNSGGVDAAVFNVVGTGASGTFAALERGRSTSEAQALYNPTEVYCREVVRQLLGHLAANQMECRRRMLAAQHDEDAMAKKPAKKKTKTKAKGKKK